VLFLKHIWFWFVIMLFLMLTMPIVPASEWFSAQAEVRANSAFYGPEANSRFIARAQQRFAWLFVDTGIYDASLKLTQPAPAKPRRTGELQEVDVWAFGTYVRQAWDGVLRALYRWETNKHWYAILVISMVACLNEGLCRRTLRPATMTYRSPANFHLVGHLLVAKVIGVLIVLPWIPFAMTWWMWVALISLLCPFWVYAALSMPTLASQDLR